MSGVCTICASVVITYEATVIYERHETKEDICKNCIMTINWLKERGIPVDVLLN